METRTRIAADDPCLQSDQRSFRYFEAFQAEDILLRQQHEVLEIMRRIRKFYGTRFPKALRDPKLLWDARQDPPHKNITL